MSARFLHPFDFRDTFALQGFNLPMLSCASRSISQAAATVKISF